MKIGHVLFVARSIRKKEKVMGEIRIEQTNVYEKLFYDSLPSSNNTHPLTVGGIDAIGDRYCRKVTQNWDTGSFGDCRWRIDNLTTGQVLENLSFPTRNDFCTWKNANIPNAAGAFTENIVLRPYDTVDPYVPKIDKLYGVNRFYTGLMGRRRSRNKWFMDPMDWDSGWWFLHHIFGVMIPDYIIIGQSWTDFRTNLGNRACYTGRNDYRRYAMPYPGQEITYTSINDRRTCIPKNWENFNNISPPITFKVSDNGTSLISPHAFIYETYGAGSIIPSYSEYPLRDRHSRRMVRETLSSNGDTSAVVAFSLTDIADPPPGEYKAVIYIKPLGVDGVYLNYYDPARYDIEVVWVQEDTQLMHFRNVSPYVVWSEERKDQMLVKKSAWLMPIAGYSGGSVREAGWYNKEGQVMPMSAYFRLRDKTTNFVGNLSRAKIVCRTNETSAPTKFMVEMP